MTSDQPLTDDQLRQVAAHMATEHGRDQVNDLLGIGEMLHEVCHEVGLGDNVLDAIDDIPDDVFDAMLDRIRDLIRDATITVEWPDASGAGRVFPAECALHGRPHTVCRDSLGNEVTLATEGADA